MATASNDSSLRHYNYSVNAFLPKSYLKEALRETYKAYIPTMLTFSSTNTVLPMIWVSKPSL
jgi:hypothetical protein